ncbi:MAG: VTT domain-containing protein [Candidatus Aenigmarchaeota archaeon]|nr:VTT domain-containing protein [Candidatus Aenigmarchaeota archaeon]
MDWASAVNAFLEWSRYMIENFGYPGVFLVSIASTATIFLPVPGFLFILAASPFLNPFLLGIVSGAGMAIGEVTGYVLGKGGGAALKRKDMKWLKRGERWFSEGRGFLFIVIFAATPLPDDVTGIVGGIFNYDVKRFLLAAFIGKTLMNIALALAGFYGINLALSAIGISL